MVEIFIALPVEAGELTQLLELRSQQQASGELLPFRQFSNNTNDIRLTITGVGKMAGATAVGAVLGQYSKEERKRIQLVNFGSCAEVTTDADSLPHFQPGLYLVDKVTDLDSGRTFYPDILCDSFLLDGRLFPEAQLLTGSRVLPAITFSYPTQTLYDMEGAGIYEAAHLFLGPHQLHFLKGVTDRGWTKETDLGEKDLGRMKLFTSQMARYARMAADYIKFLEKNSSWAEQDSQAAQITQDEALYAALSSRISDAIHASASMQHEVAQLVRYGCLAGLDVENIFQESLAKGKTPASPICRDRREGKRVLTEFRTRIAQNNS